MRCCFTGEKTCAAVCLSQRVSCALFHFVCNRFAFLPCSFVQIRCRGATVWLLGSEQPGGLGRGCGACHEEKRSHRGKCDTGVFYSIFSHYLFKFASYFIIYLSFSFTYHIFWQVCRIAIETHPKNAEVLRQARNAMGAFAPLPNPGNANHK